MDIIGEIYASGRAAAVLAIVFALAGCDSGDPPGIDFDALTDTPADGVDSTSDTSDMVADTGPTPCASHAECNDGIDCTEDLCTVAGTCQNSPDDGLCPSGQFCSLSEGCISGCSSDEDCADGLWCNGVENCFGTTCVPSSTPRSCDDGNSCTIDYCNEDIDACEYEYYPECESDVPTDTLAGDVFDPTIHYNGLFDITPTISQECGTVSYYVMQATFSSSGGILTVNAGPFNMTGTSPADAHFSVTGTYSCIQATFSGDFINSDNFIAQWDEVKISSCMCSEQHLTVGGIRH
jgi:hypothetical protein